MNIPDAYTQMLNKTDTLFLSNLFKCCPQSIIDNIIYKTYPGNHTLIHTDDTCSHVYILLKGRLQAIEENVPDFTYYFTELTSVDIIGDFELFTEETNRSITLTTMERSYFLILPSADYLNWMKKDANALFIRTQMFIRQMTKQARFDRQLLFMDNNARLLYFISSQYAKQNIDVVTLRYTREQIANKIGCSIRTVNRLIQNLQREHLISINHGKMQISRSQFESITGKPGELS